ncbi:hypothetical protein PMAYCL1PPCAC_14328, partial [Pristionchus mayeri]
RSYAMIVRWLIRVCAALLVVAEAAFVDSVDQVPDILGKRNITEKTGMVCAYADFNQDRLTDILHYHKAKLYVLLQKQRDFTDESNAETQKLIIDLQEEFADVACSVGDVNNDGFPDIVVSLRKTKENGGEWTIRYFLSHGENDAADGDKPKVKRFEQGVHAIKAKHQVALVDITGDGVHDLIGVKPDGENLLCLKGDSEAPLTKACDHLFPQFSGRLHPLMPILFADVDTDLYAELVMMKHDEKEGFRPEIWSRAGDVWIVDPKMKLELPKGVSFKHTLSPLMVDLDLNAKMDFIVPICKNSDCTLIENLQVAEWSCESIDGNACFNGSWKDWKTVTFDLKDPIVAEEDTLVRMKAGDPNLDGYPDMLVTIGSAAGGNNYASVIENRAVEDGGERKFEKSTQMLIMPGLALGMIQSSSFFDWAEDGYLDVLVQWKLRDGDDWQWSLCISEPKVQGDVTFLKVQTFAPLDGDIKDGKGVIWGGVCVKYEMETTGIGEKRKAIECQQPGNSHKAGLSPPFALFGLGRNPNFIDVATIGVPRADGPATIGIRRHEQKQIVPNARMMAQPPGHDNKAWVLRLYLTPSTLIFSSLIVMASTCTILLVVVLVLHFREKKVDRVERAAQSHRFHFDAM